MPRNLIIWTNTSQRWREVRAIDTDHFRFLPLSAGMIDDLNRRAQASASQALQAAITPPPVPSWPVGEWDED